MDPFRDSPEDIQYKTKWQVLWAWIADVSRKALKSGSSFSWFIWKETMIPIIAGFLSLLGIAALVAAIFGVLCALWSVFAFLSVVFNSLFCEGSENDLIFIGCCEVVSLIVFWSIGRDVVK